MANMRFGVSKPDQDSGTRANRKFSLSLSSRSVHCSDSRVRVFRSDLYSAIKKKKKGKNRTTLVFGFGFVFFGFE